MAQLQIVENDKHHNNSTSIELSKKEGIKYCYVCGKECSSDSILCCGKNNFMSKHVSEIVGGYIELTKRDKLKTYYKKNMPESIVKMNPKRMIHQLITHKEKINIKKETIDKIYNSNIS